MAVYVDKLKDYRGKTSLKWRFWCHMYADSEEELHEMAQKIGMKRAWFQEKRLKHYDLLPRRREEAIKCGAIDDKGQKHLKRLLREKNRL